MLLAARIKAHDGRTFDNRRVVAIRHYRALGLQLVRVFDHGEQGAILLFAIAGVKQGRQTHAMVVLSIFFSFVCIGEHVDLPDNLFGDGVRDALDPHSPIRLGH